MRFANRGLKLGDRIIIVVLPTYIRLLSSMEKYKFAPASFKTKIKLVNYLEVFNQLGLSNKTISRVTSSTLQIINIASRTSSSEHLISHETGEQAEFSFWLMFTTHVSPSLPQIYLYATFRSSQSEITLEIKCWEKCRKFADLQYNSVRINRILIIIKSCIK